MLPTIRDMIDDNSSEWTVKRKNQTAVLTVLPLPGESLLVFRVVGDIKGFSPAELRDTLWNFTLKDWQEWDSNILDKKVIEEISPTCKVWLQTNKLPWPIWPRRTLYVGKCIDDPDGTCWAVYVSVEHPKVPLEPKRYVRASVNFSAYRLQPLPNGKGSRLTRIIHVSPGGHIPASFANRSAADVHSEVEKLRRIAGRKILQNRRRVKQPKMKSKY